MQSRREFIMTKETALSKRKTLSAQVTCYAVVQYDAVVVVANTADMEFAFEAFLTVLLVQYPCCGPVRRQDALNSR